MLLSGCSARRHVTAPEAAVDTGWTERKLSEKELTEVTRENQHLDKKRALEVLARLNIRDREYIQEDITKGRPIKVPNDFGYYTTWSPMPGEIPEVSHLAKFILVVKSIPFIGWYEKGRLKSDTYICIGKKGEWTKAGLYKVENKDDDHISASYKNAYGDPALMPWALRIYGTVWIHAGDIEKANCSHGCINLPITPAQSLYEWADVGTNVLVLESLKELDKAAKSIPKPAKPPDKQPDKQPDKAAKPKKPAKPAKEKPAAQPPKSPSKT